MVSSRRRSSWLVVRVVRAVPVLALLLAGTSPALAAPGEVVLTPTPSITLGSSATKLRVLDVSGDGLLDLVATTSVAPGLQALLGHGDGTFGPPIFSPMANIDEIDLGDVNGDGHVDFVTVLDLGFSTQAMQVHLGDGSGAFAFSGDFDVSASGGAYGLRLADLDEDGDLDAVLAQSGGVRVCLGDGAGGFAAPGPLVYGGVTMVQELYVLDVNGDGHLDLLGAGYALFFTGWTVLIGDGAGGLTHFQTDYVHVDGDLFGTALGDLDGDHRADFVLNGRELGCDLFGCWLFGFAQGTTHGFASPSPAPVPSQSESHIRAGDLDGDGLADVLSSGGQIGVLLSQGDFTLGAPQYLQGGGGDLALADVDGDGRLDLFALHQQGSVKLYLNQTPPTGWSDLGHGLAGVDGVPSLLGFGELQAGAPGGLKLTHANPDKLAVLFTGPASAPTPFKGGTLVPVPPTMVFLVGTSPQGTCTLQWNAWPHLQPGTDWYFQFGIVDSAGPAGASLSNAVRALQL